MNPSYVFGILPAGSPVPDDGTEPPAEGLRLVESDGLAALVGAAPERPLGLAADLLAHDRVLGDVVAAGTPVLPMRFGAVLADDDSIVRDLLQPDRDRFTEELRRIDGHVEYVLSASYEREQVLREIVESNPTIAALRNANGGFEQQVRLGELVVGALSRLREVDADALVSEIAAVVDRRVQEVREPEEVARVAFLVADRERTSFERKVEKAARLRAGRIRLRLVGPTPAYDFVPGG